VCDAAAGLGVCAAAADVDDAENGEHHHKQQRGSAALFLVATASGANIISEVVQVISTPRASLAFASSSGRYCVVAGCVAE
jgi:hypothetical protein